jgi:hypothetical protein
MSASVDGTLAAFAAARTPLPPEVLAAVVTAVATVRARARAQAADGDAALAAWDAAIRPLLPAGGDDGDADADGEWGDDPKRAASAPGAPAWSAYRTALAAERARGAADSHDASERAHGAADPQDAAERARGAADSHDASEDDLLRTIVAAAALATAPGGDQREQELHEAVAVGCELALRLAAVLGDGQRERGWSLAGANGAVGAAVAAGRLLGCSAEQLRNAIGLAATQPGGFAEPLDAAGRAQLAGKTACNGVEAALLARAGVTAAPAAIAGRRGLLALTAPDAPADALTAGLGERWLVASLSA